MLCCGPRSDGSTEPAQPEDGGVAVATPPPSPPRSASGVPAAATPPGSYATLLLTVERGDGLVGMDTWINPKEMSLETTLDAYVQLAINDDPPFGQTDVQWKSRGDPRWDKSFAVTVPHPKSFLCVFVCDDDPVFRQDGPLALKRNCGFIEIPLWELPRNRLVSGWFALNHPDVANQDSSLADRQKQESLAQTHDAQSHLNLSAGRVKLSLTLQASAWQEVMGYMGPAPVFEESLPPLDVPGFIEDVLELKRLVMERLVLVPVRAVSYALSWDRPLLSIFLLLWHWFLCYHAEYTWASIWLLVLLCFWHELPAGAAETGGAAPGSESAPGGLTGVRHVGLAVADLVTKPIDGAKQRGLWGLVGGVKEGVLASGRDLRTGIVATHGSVSGTLRQIHGPGLQEFQQILQLKPSLRDSVRGLQRTVSGKRQILQSIDDLFYWRARATTGKVVLAVLAAFVLSIIFRGYMKVISGYAYLILGSLVIIGNTSFLCFLRSVYAMYTRTKQPFRSCTWFEAT